MEGMDSYIGYGVGIAGILAAVGQAAWQRFFSREGRANDALIQQLSERIASQEARLSTLESGLDTERKLRRLAEDRVHALELDNLLLRAELRRHNIEIPPATLPVDPVKVAG